MNRSLAAAAVLAVLLVTGCTADTREGPTTADPTLIGAELTMDVVLNDDGTVTVTAESNLPDGTELGASVFAEGVFNASDQAVLQDGEAEFGPFSQKGSALPAGAYDVSVTMPIARNQPDEVKAIIGEHGENLTGAQVSTEDITGDAVVVTSEPLVIP